MMDDELRHDLEIAQHHAQEARAQQILVLAALGRITEAQEHADAYLERWPDGPLAQQIRDALSC